MLVSVVFCLFFSATVLAADDEGCVVNGVKLKVGEHYFNSSGCKDAICIGGGRMGGKGCALMYVSPEDECEYVPEDPSKPYPECCERYINCTNDPLEATAN